MFAHLNVPNKPYVKVLYGWLKSWSTFKQTQITPPKTSRGLNFNLPEVKEPAFTGKVCKFILLKKWSDELLSKNPKPKQTNKKLQSPRKSLLLRKKCRHSCLLFVSAFLNFYLTNSKTVTLRKLSGKQEPSLALTGSVYPHIYSREQNWPSDLTPVRRQLTRGWGRSQMPSSP